jgi:hypothetical protein
MGNSLRRTVEFFASLTVAIGVSTHSLKRTCHVGKGVSGNMVWICQIRLSLSEVVELEKELKGHVRAENLKARIPDNREFKRQTSRTAND